MTKYYTKPQAVEAIQYDGTGSTLGKCVEFIREVCSYKCEHSPVGNKVETFELRSQCPDAKTLVHPGNWIVKRSRWDVGVYDDAAFRKQFTDEPESEETRTHKAALELLTVAPPVGPGVSRTFEELVTAVVEANRRMGEELREARAALSELAPPGCDDAFTAAGQAKGWRLLAGDMMRERDEALAKVKSLKAEALAASSPSELGLMQVRSLQKEVERLTREINVAWETCRAEYKTAESVRARAVTAEARLHKVEQTLIAEIGTVTPCGAEQAAAHAVAIIKRQRSQLSNESLTREKNPEVERQLDELVTQRNDLAKRAHELQAALKSVEEDRKRWRTEARWFRVLAPFGVCASVMDNLTNRGDPIGMVNGEEPIGGAK